ncbi:ABC transporter substrate-binding protein [Jiella sp. MQZ9-1]|uniref:Carbohydrate ABC transporter substrate-binding protein n=1 Tax=Jiella flava TaxID=2816857 RepID=A0A939G0R5_9HYPH|nr:ABC transporter substrate-binding protein [Jiella flava]MBO0664246.1 carbohydrate ABC transporter substrate-binding protein [Jiella flava]MCD2472892.1 ABC transporter substrate-binding protein [Jiella flava]
MTINRRTVLQGTAGLAAGAALGGILGSPSAFAQEAALPTFTPEKGASLRLLRWVPFVKAEGEAWNAITQDFTKKTGIEVRVDEESWEDVRPKAAVAASIGSGPDMVMSWFDDPFQYPDKLVDVTELGNALGKAYGGWYDGLLGYAKQGDSFIDLPLCTIGNAICYRKSHVEKAGFKEFPADKAGFLDLLEALKKQGTPAGFAFGHAVGDGNNWAHWLLWSEGGKVVDDKGEVVLDSPETKKAVEWAKKAYETFIPGTESWLDINNNRAFLAGQVSLTANGVSLYYAAANDPTMKAIANDIGTVNLPVGPVGRPMELAQTTTLSIFKHCQYPKAAMAYLAHMFEADNMNKWLEAASGYCCQSLKDFAKNPIWTSNPILAPYAKASESLTPNGYSGPLGPASAKVMADYVLVDMFAAAVTGQASTERAIANAARRAKRAYRT